MDFWEGDEQVKRLFRGLAEHEKERTSSERPGVQDHASASDSLSDRLVPLLPRYEVQGRLGEGATAFVFKGWDRELGRPVALKVLRDAAAQTKIVRARFRREAHAAGGVVHPNVVTIHDAGEAGNLLYIVMELVEGRPFSELLAERKLDQRALLTLLEKVARGVAAAHEKGIVHRDLKPDNILVPAHGEPKIGDFGLAHLSEEDVGLTRSGVMLGTPLYMAPEQVQGRSAEISPRTDVYGLGAILYEILVRHPPHTGTTVTEICAKVVGCDIIPPRRLEHGLPKPLETVCLTALDKDPRGRYPSAREFADDLACFLADEPIHAKPPGLLFHVRRGLRRGRGIALAGCLALLLAGLLVLRDKGPVPVPSPAADPGPPAVLLLLGAHKEPINVPNTRIVRGKVIDHKGADYLSVAEKGVYLVKKGLGSTSVTFRHELIPELQPGRYSFLASYYGGGDVAVVTQTFTIRAGKDGDSLAPRAVFKLTNTTPWKSQWMEAHQPLVLEPGDRVLEIANDGKAHNSKAFEAFKLVRLGK